MSVKLHANLTEVDQREFADIVYQVMACVFAMHNELGRFFDESIYKRELSRRLPAVELEVPLDVEFEPFRKRYFLDALVAGCAILEFKAVAALTDRHRSQLLQYLLLCELPHGKLINLRPESVEHEFVNCPLKRSDRTRFHLDDSAWQDFDDRGLLRWFQGLLRELGTGLDVSLYEEAAAQFLGGSETVEHEVEVVSAGSTIGRQRFRLVGSGVALRSRRSISVWQSLNCMLASSCRTRHCMRFNGSMSLATKSYSELSAGE